MHDESDLLVQPAWLEAHLDDPAIHLVDTRVGIEPQPPGPSNYTSRRDDFLAAHIPGAVYLHMVDDLSDPAGAFAFALPAPAAVCRTLGAAGISNDATIVIYGGAVTWAAHRCWWVIAAAGGRDVRLLNGDFDAWVTEGRPVQSGQPATTETIFKGAAKPHWVASRDDVIASLEQADVALVNALSAEQFAGRGQPFGRAGRIPGSISVPAAALVDPASRAFRPRPELEAAFRTAHAHDYSRLITYCGGGIAASTTFFALKLLGFDDVSLYDGSLLDWATDPTLPLEVD